MIKKKLATVVLSVTALCILFTGCSDKKNSETSDNSATPTATQDTAAPTQTATPTATPTETPTPTPTEVPEDSWVYKIVQDGFYNPAAEWNTDEELVSYAEKVSGQYIFYNDCDEYYNNFLSETNVFNDSIISLDDIERHSGDNSVKFTNRESWTKGLSGFSLMFNEDNALPIEQFNNCNATLGLWVYYRDEFNGGIPEKMNFCLWGNVDSTLVPEDTNKTKPPKEAASDDELAYYELCKAEDEYASSLGLSKLASVTIPIDTWTYVEVPFNLLYTEPAAEEQTPMLLFTTYGEHNLPNVTYYNPYYIDDITVTFNEEITAE